MPEVFARLCGSKADIEAVNVYLLGKLDGHGSEIHGRGHIKVFTSLLKVFAVGFSDAISGN
jgi:hypothetical protein